MGHLLLLTVGALGGALAFGQGCGGSSVAAVEDAGVDGEAGSGSGSRSGSGSSSHPGSGSGSRSGSGSGSSSSGSGSGSTDGGMTTDGGGSDSSADSSGSDSSADASGSDSSADASGCATDADCAAGQICGLTAAHVCGGCTTDAQCQADSTYGPTEICNTTTNVCVPGACANPDSACVNASDICCATGGTMNACTPGNCCGNAQCSGSTPICGATTPNTCGACTSDSQCGGATPVCDLAAGATQGECVAAACTGLPGASGGAPGVCTPNPTTDMCCNSSDEPGGVNQSCIPKPAGATPCCPGSAGDTTCQTALGTNAACSLVTFTCTSCKAVSTTSPAYVVDPVNGSDGATGSGVASGGTTSAACALKTIGRALQLISIVGTAKPTTITVIGSQQGVTDTAETFPLTIPANTSLTTATGAVTIVVGSATNGFLMGSASSSISSGTGAPLTITGTPTAGAPTGLNGIEVGGNAVAASTTISDLTITGFTGDDIVVGGGGMGGSITIGAGVDAEKSANGLHVTGTGAATITVAAGATATFFDNNATHGIFVEMNGAITLTGAPTVATLTTSPSGTIMTEGNGAAGIWIQQTPGASQHNLINGVVSYANEGNANGMRIVAGSNVSVLNSWFLKNGGNGVIISSGSGGTTAANNSIDAINLGSPAGAAFANNVFQQPQTENANGSAGVCLAIPTGHTASAGNLIAAVNPQALSAAGDQWSVHDCATGTGTLELNPASCDNGTKNGGTFVCANGICDLGLQGGNAPLGTTAEPNTFTVTGCTQ